MITHTQSQIWLPTRDHTHTITQSQIRSHTEDHTRNHSVTDMVISIMTTTTTIFIPKTPSVV